MTVCDSLFVIDVDETDLCFNILTMLKRFPLPFHDLFARDVDKAVLCFNMPTMLKMFLLADSQQ